jgi:hypothetical protein
MLSTGATCLVSVGYETSFQSGFHPLNHTLSKLHHHGDQITQCDVISVVCIINV